MNSVIPFNRPTDFDFEALDAIINLNREKHTRGGGDGPYSKMIVKAIKEITQSAEVFLTPSCTSALEFALLLCNINPGDEVVMPSFNFPSSALPVVNYGGIPVFVDVSPENLCIDSDDMASAITSKTKAIVWTNYGGSIPDFEKIRQICSLKGIPTIEDNAHGFGVKVEGISLGSLGDYSTHSFHETKNFQCGEGGSLQVNLLQEISRAHQLSEKGTDRKLFLNGAREKYQWVDKGGSYLLAEPLAAILWSQIRKRLEIQENRRQIYKKYEIGLREWANKRDVNIPKPCPFREAASHLFYMVLPTKKLRDNFIDYLRLSGITALFHYQDLANSPAGSKYGITRSSLKVTKIASNNLVRLPLWEMSESQVDYVVEKVTRF